MKNKLKVNICHKEYTLMSEETQEYTNKLALSVDNRIMSISKRSPSLSTVDAAVLTALDYADELEKANQNIENIRSQIKDYVDDASRARSQSDDAQREIRALKERIERLEKELKEKTVNEVPAEKAETKELEATIDKTVTLTAETKTANSGGFVGMVNYDPNGGNV
jgi:cell division protein ZapA